MINKNILSITFLCISFGSFGMNYTPLDTPPSPEEAAQALFSICRSYRKFTDGHKTVQIYGLAFADADSTYRGRELVIKSFEHGPLAKTAPCTVILDTSMHRISHLKPFEKEAATYFLPWLALWSQSSQKNPALSFIYSDQRPFNIIHALAYTQYALKQKVGACPISEQELTLLRNQLEGVDTDYVFSSLTTIQGPHLNEYEFIALNTIIGHIRRTMSLGDKNTPYTQFVDRLLAGTHVQQQIIEHLFDTAVALHNRSFIQQIRGLLNTTNNSIIFVPLAIADQITSCLVEENKFTLSSNRITNRETPNTIFGAELEEVRLWLQHMKQQPIAEPVQAGPAKQTAPASPARKDETVSSLRARAKQRCIICGQKTHLRCGACNTIYYCTKKHQKSDWKTHKTECFQLQIAQEQFEDSTSA